MFVFLYIIALLVIIMRNALNDLNNYDRTNIKRDNRSRI